MQLTSLQRALFRALVRGARRFQSARASCCTVERAVKSGVVRWDSTSAAAIEFEQRVDHVLEGAREVVATAVRHHFVNSSLSESEGLGTLRYLNRLGTELGKLHETGGFSQQERCSGNKFYIGDIVTHVNHGTVAIYGWEHSCKAQCHQDPHESCLLVDNRYFFASIESGVGGPRQTHYRILTKEGTAHYCAQELLHPLPSRPTFDNFVPINGTSFFFDRCKGARYVPNQFVAKRYPDDIEVR